MFSLYRDRATCMLYWLRNLFKNPPSDDLRRTGIVATAQTEIAEVVDVGTDSTATACPVLPTPSSSGELPVMKDAATSGGISRLSREEINANFTSWLFDRQEYSELQVTPAEQTILDTLDGILDSPQSGAQLVRRMPGVIPQLLQSLRTNDFSGAELSRKISHDVVLVAEVIRLANSSLYVQDDPITSIEHAVMVLGQNGLRHLITSVAFRPIIDLKSGYFNRLVAPRIWDHSEQCAVASRLLAEQAHLNGFDAFLAGLIQNVGLIVSLRVMDQSVEGDEAVGSAAFCNALILKTRKLSASIGREWNFPMEVITAIEEQGIVQRNTQLSAVGANLSMADYLSKLNMLTRLGRQSAEASFTSELSEAELACYVQLRTAAEPVKV
ncbi:MAG: HDOD domain-containing protein [Pseudomonadota bacterium]